MTKDRRVNVLNMNYFVVGLFAYPKYVFVMLFVACPLVRAFSDFLVVVCAVG